MIFFLQISFLGHIITLDKYILSTVIMVPREDSVCCAHTCVCEEEMGECWSSQPN